MLDAAIAQLRVAVSLATGRPIPPWALDRLVSAAVDARLAFGPPTDEQMDAITGPLLDPTGRRDLQLRRFRAQAVRARRETTYYHDLFTGLALEPARIGWDDIETIPPTPKADLRGAPDAFVRRGARPAMRMSTTGTTGTPTQIAYSAAELHTAIGLSALGFLRDGHIGPDDVVQLNTSTRAVLGNMGLVGACDHIGALTQVVGQVSSEQTLALLGRPLALPGKKRQVSVLAAYPSYLGELVETGLRLGYGPRDFGVERAFVGGEIVTQGLLRRLRGLFGDIEVHHGYALTETIPFGGTRCAHGHLHFEPLHGLMEVLSLDSARPCRPGEAGTLVMTPFPPFRDTTLLLRYDAEDVVRLLTGPLTCERAHVPATSEVLGKRRHAIRHDSGWLFPRDVLEALEDLDDVPLPARCGFWAVAGGVAVEVVTREATDGARTAVRRSLEARGVPVTEVHLRQDRCELRHPLPLRADLHESEFARTVQSVPAES